MIYVQLTLKAMHKFEMTLICMKENNCGHLLSHKSKIVRNALIEA